MPTDARQDFQRALANLDAALLALVEQPDMSRQAVYAAAAVAARRAFDRWVQSGWDQIRRRSA